MNPYAKISLAIFCIGLFIFGALFLKVLRYEYVTPEGQPNLLYTIQIDKLTGKACYIPLHIKAEEIATQFLAIERCD